MSTTNYLKLKQKKPIGGFVFSASNSSVSYGGCPASDSFNLRDFRVWFAAQEMGARRCQLDPGQVPEYTLKELHGLVGGVGGEHLRASIRRLEAVGLFTWSSTKLIFATSATALRGVYDLSDLHTVYNCHTQPSSTRTRATASHPPHRRGLPCHSYRHDPGASHSLPLLPQSPLHQRRVVQGLLDCRRLSYGPPEHQSCQNTSSRSAGSRCLTHLRLSVTAGGAILVNLSWTLRCHGENFSRRCPDTLKRITIPSRVLHH